MIAELPPAFIMLFGALLVPFLRGRLRSATLLLLPVLSFVHLLGFSEGSYAQITLFDHPLIGVRIDRLALVFGYIFHIAAFLGILFSLHVKDTTQHVSVLLYAGASIGAVFAGDLVTLFVYWELTAVSSVFLVWARRTERSYSAGMRYLVIQVGSGVLLLAGIVVRVQQGLSLDFGLMSLSNPGDVLIFLAFGIKCGFPLLHNWLTDAYPEATVTGTVFLSAFTTKLAVYALARSFPGAEPLIYIGVVMTAFPIFYAVIENDLRRVLVYSMINQIGYMVVGIGLGTELALNGAVSHAFVHILYKGLLFMAMGAVLYRTGTIRGSDLGGLYKSMPVTTVTCIIAAASISAFPLFSGFVTKAMIMAAALEEGHEVVWLVLLFASAGVFHHAGIKIPFFAFFSHDSGIRCREAPRNMLVAMVIAAALCIYNGSFPRLLFGILPYELDYVPYTSAHVISQLQLLLFSALAFCWLKLSGLYPPELRSVNVDAEWVYRRALPSLVHTTVRIGTRVREAAVGAGLALVKRVILVAGHLFEPRGVLGRTWSIDVAVLWVVLFLGFYLLAYYLMG